MTGFFVRILRDGKFQAVEIEELTLKELDAFEEEHPDRGWFFARGLIRWIKENIKEAK